MRKTMTFKLSTENMQAMCDKLTYFLKTIFHWWRKYVRYPMNYASLTHFEFV